ncbi:MAG TPA: hypothetical protein VFI37_02155 [Gaiellaceae bacterium]|nr:hypothetical protein [Gaiellaceae bacterium]
MIDELSRELAAVGIRGRVRARILAEAAEHLREGPAEDFGDPRTLARQFAEAVGTAEARRASRVSLGALVAVGTVFAIVLVSIMRAGSPRDIFGGGDPPLGFLAAVGAVVLPQVSFVAGVLAPVARTPRNALRRAAVGLAAGAGSLGCAVLFAVQFQLHVPWLWAAAPGVAAAAVAGGYTARAARIRTGAVVAELTLSWRQALAVAALVAVAFGVAGASGGDPTEGIRNAVGETIACLSCFAVSGKYLGLRR